MKKPANAREDIDMFFYIQKLHVHTCTLQTGAKGMVPGASEQAQKAGLEWPTVFFFQTWNLTILC